MGAASWLDSSGNFWLFGGSGYDSAGYSDLLNDLWKYDPEANEWTWISGSHIGEQVGVYGTKGVADSSNVPGARSGAVSWIDASGSFWLFGGEGIFSVDTTGNWFNDLWKFDQTTQKWAWMSGSNAANPRGTYGTQGKTDPSNAPGARSGAVSWIDSSGKFWLFGGEGSILAGGYLNDLWQYTR
jgi:N-acetylneuraminic acid mutarotase